MIASLAQETKTAIGASLDGETSLQAVCTAQSTGITAFLNTSVRIPDHLEIEGDWNGVCVCGHPVSENIENMVFKCVYRNGSYSLCTPTPSPEIWGETEGEQAITFSYEEGGVVITASKSAYINKPKPVGGIIFYIDDAADGTYRFWDANGDAIEAPTVGTDCTGWTYMVEGASKDKFYVVHNQLYTSKIWGGAGTAVGASGSPIGTGRSNTNKAIGSVADVIGSIWELIRSMRSNEVGGCDDWYAGSRHELEALYNSNAGDSASWFAKNFIWTSTENGSNYAWYWHGNSHEWGAYRVKGMASCICGIRSF